MSYVGYLFASANFGSQAGRPIRARETIKRRADQSTLSAVVTQRFKLNDIEAAYDLFSDQRNGVLKVAVTP